MNMCGLRVGFAETVFGGYADWSMCAGMYGGLVKGEPEDSRRARRLAGRQALKMLKQGHQVRPLLCTFHAFSAESSCALTPPHPNAINERVHEQATH